MKRKYVYIIAIVLSLIYVGSEHYLNLSIEKSTNLEQLESQKYLQSSDFEEELNTNIATDYKAIEPQVSLTITNIQNDKTNIEYKYYIKLNDVSGAYRISRRNEEKYLLFSSTGEVEITLNSNETITIYDLPGGTSYQIEQKGGNSSKYTIKANNIIGTKTNGILSKNTKITFENKIPIKEKEETSNPYTADIYTLAIILFVITTIIFISIRQIKIKRFE